MEIVGVIICMVVGSLVFFTYQEGLGVLVLSLIFVWLGMQSDFMLGWGVFLDSLSWNMVFLSLLVSLVMLSSPLSGSSSMVFPISLSLIIVLLYFLSVKMVFFFVLFEVSLIPLMYMVLAWGRQAERLLASQFMMVYTVVASSPLLFLSLSMESEGLSYFFTNFYPVESLLPLFGVLAFLVKIPLFFLHSWLPKAHVEAPLEGSMILAGIMLKVGMYGLIRVSEMFQFSQTVGVIIFSLCSFGTLVSSVLALSSDDLKMSVAYSSVSHMNMVVASYFSFKLSGVGASLIIMVTHGVLSPLLFFFVTLIYKATNSRSVLVTKGAFSKIPLFGTLGLLLWASNISVPPFFSFIGEVLGFSSILSIFPPMVGWVIGVMVLGSFYSIVNYGVQCHSSFKVLSKISGENFSFLLVGVFSLSFLTCMFLFPPMI